MYRDHRKGPGGPPGGATYPGGLRGLKWEGNQPLVGWCTPLGAPLRLGLETLGGGAPLALGGTPPPWPPPPWEIPISRTGAPQEAYIKEGRASAAAPCVLAPPSPYYTSSSSRNSLAKPCRSSTASTTTPSCCWIFINLSFPLDGSRRRRRHADRTCVECGGAIRSALGSPVIGSRRERLPQPRSLERFRTRSTRVCRCISITRCLDELIDGSW